MGLTVKATSGGSGGTFTPVPPGMHLARCYRIVDMGTQKSVWQGKEKHLHKVMIQFEIHSEDANGTPLLTDKGEPLSISKNMTASLGEKAALRIELENWRSRPFTPEELNGFELKNILGAWAMLSVIKAAGADGKEYTNISSINPVAAAMRRAGLPEGHNELKVFDLENPDLELFETFSNYTKEKIQSSPEWELSQGSYQKGAIASANSPFPDEDIPF